MYIATTRGAALCFLLSALAAGCPGGPDRAVDRAADWLADAPPGALRFDAAVVLSQVRRLRASPAVERALQKALAVAATDDDNPHRRFFDADAGTTREAVAGWSVPDARGTNAFVSEALWCDVFGLRAATVDALERLGDDGGYRTTHAVWALELAQERGCLDAAAFGQRSAGLRAELRRTQPEAPGPGTMDLDLFGERLVMLRLAGEHDGALDRWTAALRARQNRDGSFGTDGTNVQRAHATMIAAWALALK